MGAVLSEDLKDGGGRKERLDVLVLGEFDVVGVCEDCEETLEGREGDEAFVDDAVDDE